MDLASIMSFPKILLNLKKKLWQLRHWKRNQQPDWVREGQLTAAGSEIRYWEEKGIHLGTNIYDRYLTAFKLSAGDLASKSIADFGCGPFGGILAIVETLTAFPIDVLADEYNNWGHSAFPVYLFDGKTIAIEDGVCDIVFCTNALDHTPNPQPSVKEIIRILKPGGRVFLHVHLRRPYELNKAHPVSWSVEFAHQQFAELEVVWEKEHSNDWINDKPYRMLLSEFRKPIV